MVYGHICRRVYGYSGHVCRTVVVYLKFVCGHTCVCTYMYLSFVARKEFRMSAFLHMHASLDGPVQIKDAYSIYVHTQSVQICIIYVLQYCCVFIVSLSLHVSQMEVLE